MLVDTPGTKHCYRTGVRIESDASRRAEEHGFESVFGLQTALCRSMVNDDVKERAAGLESFLGRSWANCPALPRGSTVERTMRCDAET